MAHPSFRLALPCLAVLALLASCSEPRNPNPVMREEPGGPVSDADRQAAQALSISNRGAAQEAGSPYEQAQACSMAISVIAERLGQSDLLTGEQAQALERAKAVYDRRVQTLATARPKAEADIAAPEQDGAGSPEVGEMAFQAMDCLRKLDQGV